MSKLRQAISVVLCPVLVIGQIGLDGCKKESKSEQQDQAPAVTYAAPSPDQLYQLVAPIALFPDNLVAQVLAASTYPDQITEAWNWLQQNRSTQGQQLMQAVNEQNWDVSVKGLTQFSDVLQQMATNLSWTSALGDAYYNSPQNVMNAVQVMRQRAYQAGNLKSTPQQNVSVQNESPAQAPAAASSGASQVTVVQSPPQTIVIQPSQPDVVYVPTYNPTVVYGAPVPAYPGYSTGDMVATGLISFGVGMMVGAAMSNSCCGWGWNSWGCGWNNASVTYNRNVYISNSNTFVNRNNYYNRNNINTANINRNDINRNNINRNDINRNNINRNDINRNNANRGGSFSTPHFDQSRNEPQFRDQGRGNGAQQRPATFDQQRGGNLGQQRAGNQPSINPNNRAGGNLSQPSVNANNRAGSQIGQGNRAQTGVNQNNRQDVRGYGNQSSNRAASNNALGNYGQGGNARANSARGQQSFNGGGNRNVNTAARSGGGAAANRGAGGAQGRRR